MRKTMGYHCATERYKPSELLNLIRLAEKAGFDSISCSDYFYPWSERQGQSAFAWSWLGAAMSITKLPFGIVTAPVQRYHPVMIAQALATLAELFPQRLWCAFGSGQWLNEHITGGRWPDKNTRNDRLKEAVDIIRALLKGETISLKGKFFTLDEVRLHTLPHQIPLLLGSALSEKSAKFIGSFMDGIITTSKPYKAQRKFIDSFLEESVGSIYKPFMLMPEQSRRQKKMPGIIGGMLLWEVYCNLN